MQVSRETVFKCDWCCSQIPDGMIVSAGMYDMRYGTEHSVCAPVDAITRGDEPIRFTIERKDFLGKVKIELCHKCLVKALRDAANYIENGGAQKHDIRPVF